MDKHPGGHQERTTLGAPLARSAAQRATFRLVIGERGANADEGQTAPGAAAGQPTGGWFGWVRTIGAQHHRPTTQPSDDATLRLAVTRFPGDAASSLVTYFAGETGLPVAPHHQSRTITSCGGHHTGASAGERTSRPSYVDVTLAPAWRMPMGLWLERRENGRCYTGSQFAQAGLCTEVIP